MRWTRKFIPFLTLALMLPALANAAPTPPETLAKQTVQKVLSDMNGKRDELRKNPQALYDLINRDLVPLIDLPYMSRLVLGRYSREASPEQLKRFQTAFKNMLIRTYGSALLGFNDNVNIEYKPVRADDDAKNVTFNAVIHSQNGQDTPVSLQLHLVNDEWKVYDGSVGNLSFVTNYRGQINAQIRRNGLENVIEQMEKRYNPGS
ncbi:phospholipid-binding protein MlaC [Salinisphaera sp. Q1T1-3]|uniref:MlaC/ttg2D family ABC transporter substrate-binding protein n=1 Tax=Salinisphaera sp. Q1T1-3 TaxID=2321229 RepID=UPI000E725B38|nr:ABC transporter substrate-binding protein [Salinisphaera sp. Q1T1-3]RJS94634.1 ABC transporter substrate-binding protein [Salinisphaera sp. Q1T1-3]